MIYLVYLKDLNQKRILIKIKKLGIRQKVTHAFYSKNANLKKIKRRMQQKIYIII